MDATNWIRHNVKLPGPAGCLSDEKTYGSQTHSLKMLFSGTGDGSCLVSSQPWEELKFLVGFRYSFYPSNNSSALQKMTLDWISRHLLTNLDQHRVPFILAVITTPIRWSSRRYLQNVTQMSVDAGSIDAAVDPQLVSQFGDILQPGTAVAMHNVGFIAPKAKPMLLVSMRNLIAIAAMKPSTIPIINNSQGVSFTLCLTSDIYLYKAPNYETFTV